MLHTNELTHHIDHTGITGKFHYDSLDNVSKGHFVSYTNDRLVFYESEVLSKDFTGYVRSVSFMIVDAI